MRRATLAAWIIAAGCAAAVMAWHPASPGAPPFVWAALAATHALSGRAALGAYLLRSAGWTAALSALLALGVVGMGMSVQPTSALIAGAAQASLLVPLLELSEAASRFIEQRLSPPGQPVHRIARAAAWLSQAALLALCLPALFLSINTRRAHGVTAPTPLIAARRLEPVTFEGAGSTRLRGVLVRGGGPRGLVVVAHGLGADMWQFLPAAEALHRRGYDVLAFDQRGHGSSGGVACTLGLVEALDVEAAVAFARARTGDRPGPVILLGISMGGAAAQVAASRMPVVDGVVLDSTFASLDAVAARALPLPSALRAPALALGAAAAPLLTGHALLSFSPVDAATAPRDHLLLVIHADDDPLVPYAEGRRIAEAYRDRATLLTIHGAHHAVSFARERATYDAALDAFAARLEARRASMLPHRTRTNRQAHVLV